MRDLPFHPTVFSSIALYSILSCSSVLYTKLLHYNLFDCPVEPPLNFYPTYKLDIESDEYDTGAKKRIPAWTDRVLYVPSSGFECTAYNSDTSLRTSDHRPVFASFSATIKTDHNLLDLPGGQSARSDMSMNHPAFSSETQVCSIM